MDRRRGLPVALAIIYIHAARGIGWPIEGLNFPGRFLVRLGAPDGRAVLDPFEGGEIRDAVALRELLKFGAGAAAELAPEHFAQRHGVAGLPALERIEHRASVRRAKADEETAGEIQAFDGPADAARGMDIDDGERHGQPAPAIHDTDEVGVHEIVVGVPIADEAVALREHPGQHLRAAGRGCRRARAPPCRVPRPCPGPGRRACGDSRRGSLPADRNQRTAGPLRPGRCPRRRPAPKAPEPRQRPALGRPSAFTHGVAAAGCTAPGV